MLKNILKTVLYNISFLFSLLSCLKIFLKLRKKNIDVFFSPEGGFGPTISKAVILRCKYKQDNNFVLVFGYSPVRHNRLISDLFDQNFLWLSLTNKFIPYNLVSEKYKYLIFKILKYLLKNFSNIKNIEYFNEYFCNLWNIENFHKEKKNKFGSYRKIHEFINNNEKYINYNKNVFQKIKEKINLDFNEKKCTIFLRSKGKNSSDISAKLRDTDIFDNYRLAVESNIKRGWQFFISGDQIKKPEWVKKFSSSIIFYEDTSLTKDEYNVFTGLYSDCFISSGSGPVSWKFTNLNKPFLVVDGYPFGFGWYKTTVAYKIINDQHKFASIEEIFDEKGLEIEPQVNSSYLNLNEKNLVISEFLNNSEKKNNDGLSWKDLNLKEDCLLNTGHAKASKEWHKIQKLKFNSK